MNYLTPEHIAAGGTGELTADQVRSAVFRLWLEPDDAWSRCVLVEYAGFLSSNRGRRDRGAWDTALISRMMSRIAHGIHRYDRYKEPLRVFLRRIAINAERDLLATYTRFHAEELDAQSTNPKVHPPLSNAAKTRRINKAAKTLGVTLTALLKFLFWLKYLRGTEDATITAMAVNLGVSPGKLEAFIYGLMNAGDGTWLETPPDLDELAREIGMSAEQSIEGEIAAQGHDAEEGRPVIQTEASADKRFEDYLYKLSDEVPFGEKVDSAPAVKKNGFSRPVMQPLQMSREEIDEARRQLWLRRDKIEFFRSITP